MLVTFPHIGPLYLPLSKLLSYLNIPYIIPPKNSDNILKRGVSVSPDEICLPFKYMVGNLLYAYEEGADTVLMIATCGPCRLGKYCEILKCILDKYGYEFQWIVIDSVSQIGIKGLVERLDILVEDRRVSKIRVLKGIALCVRLIQKMDAFRKLVAEGAGYLDIPMDAIKLLKRTEKYILKAKTFKECFDILNKADAEWKNNIFDNRKKPVKILLTGEIYTTIDSFANGMIEERLIRMGCSVRRQMDLSWWIKNTFVYGIIPSKLKDMFDSEKALSNTVGGYGRETLNQITEDKWFDGVIKIMPAGCMPEIVTKAYCENVLEHNNTAILHLIFDEMSGEVGYETRIEAFVDMLERKKKCIGLE